MLTALYLAGVPIDLQMVIDCKTLPLQITFCKRWSRSHLWRPRQMASLNQYFLWRTFDLIETIRLYSTLRVLDSARIMTRYIQI